MARKRSPLIFSLVTFVAFQIVIMVAYHKEMGMLFKAVEVGYEARSALSSQGWSSNFAASSADDRSNGEGSSGESAEGEATRVGKLRSTRNSSMPLPGKAKVKTKNVTAGARTLRVLQAQAVMFKAMTSDQITVFPAGNENEVCVGQAAESLGVVAPVVTVAFDREDYLERMLKGLLEVHGSSEKNKKLFPLFVSQDGDDPAVQQVVFTHLGPIRYLQHVERTPPVPITVKEKLAYYRIANHYKFIFKTFFDCFGYSRLIVLEDDMQVAPDFFQFFQATAPLLDRDRSLFCVSSWNDHGQDRFVRDPQRLYRSDFFPGLGWMTSRAVWNSIKSGWPRGYWDDWMRLNSTRRGRQCIRPEICRNYNFGVRGSSQGQFYRQFLKPILLNTHSVPWTDLDLSYLEPTRYQQELNASLAAAEVAGSAEAAWRAQGDVVLYYSSMKHYERLALRLKIMKDWKDGTPRGGYRGVVTLRNSHGMMLYLAPSPSFNLTAPAPDERRAPQLPTSAIRRGGGVAAELQRHEEGLAAAAGGSGETAQAPVDQGGGEGEAVAVEEASRQQDGQSHDLPAENV